MRKKVFMATVLAGLSFATTPAMAAKSNPFVDVPKDHWAYSAIQKLVDDGVLEGYPDGTYRGNKLMDRYEMAAMVGSLDGKIDKVRKDDKAAIRRLQKEFKNELGEMDMRVTSLEEDMQKLKDKTKTNWYGSARVKYHVNPPTLEGGWDNVTGAKSPDYKTGWRKGLPVKGNGNLHDYNDHMKGRQNELKLQLGYWSEISPNLWINGRIQCENQGLQTTNYGKVFGRGQHGNGKSYESFAINKAEMTWAAPNNFEVKFGRNEYNLGQGLIWWENPMDGISVKKTFGAGKYSLNLGYADAGSGTWNNYTQYTGFADFKAQLSKATQFTVAYYASKSDAVHELVETWSWDNGSSYWAHDGSGKDNWKSHYVSDNMRQLAVGFNTKLNNKWTLTAEGLHNSASITKYGSGADEWVTNVVNAGNYNRNAWWARLDYGKLDWTKANTWKAWLDIVSAGGLSINSSAFCHRLPVAFGNGYGGSGARGIGIGYSYQVTNALNAEIYYARIRPFDKASAGFDRYADTGYVSLAYGF